MLQQQRAQVKEEQRHQPQTVSTLGRSSHPKREIIVRTLRSHASSGAPLETMTTQSFGSQLVTQAGLETTLAVSWALSALWGLVTRSNLSRSPQVRSSCRTTGSGIG